MRRIIAQLLIVVAAVGGLAARATAAPLPENERTRQFEKITLQLAQSSKDPHRAQQVREPLRQLRRLRASLPNAEPMLLQMLAGPDADALAGDVGDVLRILGPDEKQKVQNLAAGGTIPQSRAAEVIREFTLLENAEKDLANSTDAPTRTAAANLIATGNAATHDDLDVALSDSVPGVLQAAAKMARDLPLNPDEWERLGELAGEKDPDVRREATVTLLADGEHTLPALDRATVALLRSDPEVGKAASAWLTAHTASRSAAASPSAATSGSAAPAKAASASHGNSFAGIAVIDAILFAGGIVGWLRRRTAFGGIEGALRGAAIGGWVATAGFLAAFALMLAGDQQLLGSRLWSREGMIPLAIAALPACAAVLWCGWSMAATSGRSGESSILMVLAIATLLGSGLLLANDGAIFAPAHILHAAAASPATARASWGLPPISRTLRLGVEAALLIASLWTFAAVLLFRIQSVRDKRSAPEVTLVKVPPLPFNLE